MTAIIDTSVIFARQNERDQYHETALEIITAVDHGELPDLHIIDSVLGETMDLIRTKSDHRTATRTLDALVEGSHFELVHTPDADFHATQALFRRYSHLSFVDASIVAYAQRTGIEHLYSFDDDFDEIDGLTRLNAPIDPRK